VALAGCLLLSAYYGRRLMACWKDGRLQREAKKAKQ